MTIIGNISAKIVTIDDITIIEAAAALFLIFSCSLFTKGFRADASTKDANNIINSPLILGISNNTNTASTVNIIVLTLKNFLSMFTLSLM